jgi:predicted porin
LAQCESEYKSEEIIQMQKKIIALAVAAAFSAPAFADVTAYGVVDAVLAHVSADGQKSDIQALSGGLSSSRIGFKAVEDLDNGMKAVAVLEYGLDTQTNSSVGAARQQMLAVAGGFGTFATGYLQTTGYDFAVKFDPTAGSAVSPLQSVTNGNLFLIGSSAIAARAQRALAYISPDLGGVTVAVNYTTGLTGLGDLTVADNVAVQSKSTAYLLSATYNGGPLAVGVVYTSATLGTGWSAVTGSLATETSTLSPKEYALGASYDLGVVKLSATYQNFKSGTNNLVPAEVSNKAMSFSAVAPVGPGAIVASYAKNTMQGTNVDGKGFTVAYLQGLSKTTTAYAGVQKISNGTNTGAYTVLNNAVASVTNGGSSTAIVFGLNKKF